MSDQRSIVLAELTDQLDRMDGRIVLLEQSIIDRLRESRNQIAASRAEIAKFQSDRQM